MADKTELRVNPSGGETKEHFISRCIAHEINAGHEDKQAAAICYSIWDNHFSSDELSREDSIEYLLNMLKEKNNKKDGTV